MDFIKIFWGIRGLVNKPFFAKFGKFSYLGKPIIIRGKSKISIGNKVRIYPGIRMEAIDEGKIVIEDNVSIAQNFHVTAKSKLVIGKNTTILGNSFITDIDHDYENIDVHIMNQKMIVKKTEIGENCFIGYGAAIQAGTILGKQCIVGTNAVVRGTFPDYCVIVGAPAKIVKKYNTKTNEWEKFHE